MDFFQRHQELWEEYNKTVRDRGYTYGIQKERLLVKMKPDTSMYDLDIVSTGLT